MDCCLLRSRSAGVGYKGHERKRCIPHFRFPSCCTELPDVHGQDSWGEYNFNNSINANENFPKMINVTSLVNVVAIFNVVLDILYCFSNVVLASVTQTP